LAADGSAMSPSMNKGKNIIKTLSKGVRSAASWRHGHSSIPRGAPGSFVAEKIFRCTAPLAGAGACGHMAGAWFFVSETYLEKCGPGGRQYSREHPPVGGRIVGAAEKEQRSSLTVPKLGKFDLPAPACNGEVPEQCWRVPTGTTAPLVRARCCCRRHTPRDGYPWAEVVRLEGQHNRLPAVCQNRGQR